MRAVVFDRFGGRPEVREETDPAPPPDGVVVRVEATGLCRSDWHGWVGHDPDITSLPHVPGHELAGTVASVGTDVDRWRVGQRVTTPFVCACGSCAVCRGGDGQVCPHQTQPGFTHWGSFAELVVLRHADVNLVAVPEDVDVAVAAVLGCRVGTAYRAVTARADVRAGEWVSVHGCGGVGLAVVMVAVAAGARVVAVDVDAEALALAAALGAEVVVDAATIDDVPAAIVEATEGGAHASFDALGSAATAADSILALRRRGRQVQIGLLPEPPPLPMGRVIGYELDVRGSHGLAAPGYPALLREVASGRLPVERLIRRRIGLDDIPTALEAMGGVGLGAGMTVAVVA